MLSSSWCLNYNALEACYSKCFLGVQCREINRTSIFMGKILKKSTDEARYSSCQNGANFHSKTKWQPPHSIHQPMTRHGV
jgi:hypothetical protein